jgi:hypothetical protein
VRCKLNGRAADLFMSGHYVFVSGQARVSVGTLAAMPRPATGKTPKRSVRVSDEKWEAVKAQAAAEGKTASDIVNECLDVYLGQRRGRGLGSSATR